MRHERRNLQNCDFFTPLTSVGKHNAKVKIFNNFDKIHLDEIYSSPYKRALDTVSTLSEVNNIPIRIDYGLAEFIDDISVSDKLVWPSVTQQLELHSKYIIDTGYISTSTNEYIDTYSESESSFIKRIDNFINYISTKTNKNILIVTHQTPADRLIFKYTGSSYNLEMGEYVKIMNNKIC